MATKRMTELNKQLASVNAEIRLLNAEIDKYKKAGASAIEVEAKFGSKLLETKKAYFDVTESIKKYDSANRGNIKTNKGLRDEIIKLITHLNTVRSSHNSLVSTVNKLSDSDKKLTASTRASSKAQDDSARASKARAKAAEDALKSEAKAVAAAEKVKEKAREKERKAQERAAAQQKKQGDLLGGIGSAFSPNAIGRAIGSVTKFVSIYNILSKAVDGLRSVTLGSIQAFIDFEASIARIRAIAGATASETNKLEASIRSVAGTTIFTLTEVSLLTEELLKLGFSADQAAQSILPVAQTAQALGQSAGEVAMLLGTIGKSFGLTTAEISATGDILVGSVNRSALSFDSFRTAIQYVGPIARQNGVALSETAAAMALLANAGFTASRIGTGLRQVFIKLGQSGENVIDQLEELAKTGVSLGEALEITDVRTAAAVSTLALGAPLIRQMAADFERTGRAAQASAIQTGTFAGQTKLLNSAYNDFQVTLGSVISKSNLLINVIGFLSRAAESAATAARLISSEQFNIEAYSNAVQRVADSYNDVEQAAVLAREAARGLAPASGLTGGKASKDIDALAESIIRAAGVQNDFKKSTQATVDFYNDYEKLLDSNATSVEKLGFRVAELGLELQNGSILSKDQRIQKEAEKKAIEDLILAVGRERDARKLLDEDAKKTRGVKAKLDTDDLKRRKAQIKEEIKLIEQQRQQELKSLEERAKLQGDAATSTQERASIELKLNQDITALNEKTNERLEYQFGQFIDLSDDAGEVIKKYGTEFPDVVEDLSNNINDLNGDFFSLSKSIEMSLSDVANDAIGDAKSILSTYQKQVEKLNDEFGENAGKTEEYFAALEGITTNLSAELLGVAAGLNRATVEGEAAYQIILQLLDKVESAAKRPAKGEGDFDWGSFWDEILVDSLESAIETSLKALDRFNDTVLENTTNRLRAQFFAIQANADTENSVLKSQLDNQLITEEEFRNRADKNRKREADKLNQVEKQIFDAENKRDRQQARSDFLQALGSVIINEIRAGNPLPAALINGGIAAAFATAGYASQLSAINQREFFPRRFAEGGMVEGPSHSQGGVPFSVAGRGGYEMEGGEFIVNKRAANLHRSLLEKINSSAKPAAMSGSYAYDSINRIPSKFATGGSVSPEEANRVTQEQLSYLRAIAESNVAVASNTSKPVRAFVTQTDLRNNELDRRIVNKNNRL